jgi:O-antigen ligase
MSKDSRFALLICCFYAIVVVTGGHFLELQNRILLLSVFGSVVLVFSVWRMRDGLPSRSANWGLAILAAGVAIMVMQLVPLPPKLWSLLPARSFLIQDFTVIGIDPGWMPLSLSPYSTRQGIIAILPGVAAYFAVISVPARHWKWIASGVISLALLASLVALAQKFQGPNGPFNFFNEQGEVTATGFFANRNFLAAQLYCAIPFAAALTFCTQSDHGASRLVWAVLGVFMILVLVAGVGASGSRMGAILVVAALLMSLIIYLTSPSRNSIRGGRRSGLFAVVLLVGGLIVAQLCLTALLRFSQTDVSSDYRSIMHATSLKAAFAFFPFGSGFGSFVPVYQLYESPDFLISSYVNHAHSDWIELLLEGGLPIVLVLACFGCWLAFRIFPIWRSRETSPFAKAASVSVILLLIHSFQDYPLRAPALLTLLGLCLGMLAINTGKASPHFQTKTSSRSEGEVHFKPRTGGFSSGRRN